MPKIEPEWEEFEEAEELVAKLIDTYPEKLGHVMPSDVGVAVITNKDRPDSADWFFKISGVTMPDAIFCTKKYVIQTYQNTWEEFGPCQRQWALMGELLRIPDPPDGTLIKKDLHEMKALVRVGGVDYLNSPSLADLLTDKQDF